MEDLELENILDLVSGATCDYSNCLELVDSILDSMSTVLTVSEMEAFTKRFKEDLNEKI